MTRVKIHKLFETPPQFPGQYPSEALAQFREKVLADAKKRLPERAYQRIAEKFLKPQVAWVGTVKSIADKGLKPDDVIEIQGIANKAERDRGRERIPKSAWDLENYAKNPVILFNHNYNHPIGYCTEYAAEDEGLSYRAIIGDPKAFPELTECQRMCRSLLAQNVLRASSVGILPLDLEYDEESDTIVYVKVELLEISLVPVPMQQGSLLESVAAAKHFTTTEVKTMDKEQFDKLYKLCEEHKGISQRILEELLQVDDEAEQADEEEKKSLRAKIAELEGKLKTVTEEKEALEKEAKELLETLEKAGIDIESK